jgi:hypothetical protein
MCRLKTMTLVDPNEAARIEATDFACRLVPCWRAVLGTELIGAYLIGSLAHSGFSRRYSDVDIALITQTGLTQKTLDRMQSQAFALSAEWGAKLSIFGLTGTSASADFHR